jgi:hypothetical protein
MAWTFDTKTTGTRSADNPWTVSHTCSGSTELLVVCIFVNGTSARTGGAPTYNGDPLTDSGEGGVFNAECGTEVWYLLTPDTGASYTLSIPNTGLASLNASVMSFEPSGIVGDLDNANSGSGTDANPDIQVSTTNNNCLMVGSVASGFRDTPTAGTNYTEGQTDDAGNQTWG